MTKYFYALIVAAALITSPACKSKSAHKPDEKNVITTEDIPGLVQSNFKTKYPNATEVFWEDAHEGESPTFKVKFKNGDKYWKAEFKGDGTLVKEKED